MMDKAKHAETYESFRAAYAPHIRPPETEERLKRAFEIDVSFVESFRLIRPYLRRFKEEWADAILAHVTQSRSAEGAFSATHAAAFGRIFRRHFGSLYRGAFDAAYLKSVEDVALYMIYRDVKSVWLAGAYQKLLLDITRQIFADTPNDRMIRLERVICTASKMIAIEMNQIQRVFTVYESYRLNTLLTLPEAAEAARAEALLSKTPLARLNDTQIAAIRRGYAAIEPNHEAFARKFQRKLSESRPELAARYLEAKGAHENDFIDTLTLVIGGLDEPAEIAPIVEDLGRRHVKFGGAPADHRVVGDALLWTLERGLGEDWTPGAKDAWVALYRAMASTMMEATR